jgi:hypothetical protein
MSENESSVPGGESTVGRVVFWGVVIVAALVALRLVFAAVGLVVFLAFRLLPIIVVGWLLYRAWKWIADKPAHE